MSSDTDQYSDNNKTRVMSLNWLGFYSGHFICNAYPMLADRWSGVLLPPPPPQPRRLFASHHAARGPL